MSKVKTLLVYKKAFALSMHILEVSKSFPKEEKYSLTDQVRRSSRSVCANLAEGYMKRKYPKHFIAKISDCDMENSETSVWLDFALTCNYIDKTCYDELIFKNAEVGKLLGSILKYPQKYL